MPPPPPQDFVKKKKLPQQTNPPSTPVTELFPPGEFPEGEIQQYKDDNLWRTTSEKKFIARGVRGCLGACLLTTFERLFAA
ncbi:unnamed protein product [Arabis nemorensis]|uniref:Uncharacterized protein n=1 Tax=Arabis nemorensis TaxID=586526 RepID=A0A565BC72_9BRAS|nr:unnamed protein product [Arabis nemorensis]